MSKHHKNNNHKHNHNENAITQQNAVNPSKPNAETGKMPQQAKPSVGAHKPEVSAGSAVHKGAAPAQAKPVQQGKPAFGGSSAPKSAAPSQEKPAQQGKMQQPLKK